MPDEPNEEDFRVVEGNKDYDIERVENMFTRRDFPSMMSLEPGESRTLRIFPQQIRGIDGPAEVRSDAPFHVNGIQYEPGQTGTIEPGDTIGIGRLSGGNDMPAHLAYDADEDDHKPARMDDVDSLRFMLDSEGVVEALKAGASLSLTWQEHALSNENYNVKVSDDHAGDPVVDDRETVDVVVPVLKIEGKREVVEGDYDPDYIYSRLTREIEARDQTLTDIQERLDEVADHQVRNNRPPKRSSGVGTFIWTLLCLVAGTVVGSIMPELPLALVGAVTRAVGG